MKKTMIVASFFLVAGCSNAPQQDQSHFIGKANPASAYCIKQGGKLDIVKGADGEMGYCTLPSGERIDEWSLFYRDNVKN